MNKIIDQWKRQGAQEEYRVVEVQIQNRQGEYLCSAYVVEHNIKDTMGNDSWRVISDNTPYGMISTLAERLATLATRPV